MTARVENTGESTIKVNKKWKELTQYRKDWVLKKARRLFEQKVKLSHQPLTNPEEMGNLIERANNALIMQKDAMRQQSARIDELSGKVSRQSSTIRKMAPKVEYYDRVLDAPDTYCVTAIAKSYGMKGWQMNQFLHEQRVQYRLHDGWVLYAKYDGKGYTRKMTCIRKYDDGTEKVRVVTKWTQKGWQFIDKLLQKAFGTEGSDERMKEAKTDNRSAYIRKMALDGFFLEMDDAPLKEMNRLLRSISNNFNQVAKRANSSGNVYETDLLDMAKKMNQIWDRQNQLIMCLSSLK